MYRFIVLSSNLSFARASIPRHVCTSQKCAISPLLIFHFFSFLFSFLRNEDTPVTSLSEVTRGYTKNRSVLKDGWKCAGGGAAAPTTCDIPRDDPSFWLGDPLSSFSLVCLSPRSDETFCTDRLSQVSPRKYSTAWIIFGYPKDY